MNKDLIKETSLDMIAIEIDNIIESYRKTKSVKLRKELSKDYLELIEEYHTRTGNKNIYHKNLVNIK